MTQSISTTAVVIKVHEPRMTSAEVLIEIPLVASGCLFGQGRVVRTATAQEAAGMATVTVSLDRYRIGRRADPPPRTLVA